MMKIWDVLKSIETWAVFTKIEMNNETLIFFWIVSLILDWSLTVWWSSVSENKPSEMDNKKLSL